MSSRPSQRWHDVWNDRDPTIVDFNGYDLYFDADAYATFSARQADLITEILDLRNTDRLLDLGCGTGRLTRQLAARVDSILAVDYSEDAIEVARAQRGAPNVEYRVADLSTFEPDKCGANKAVAVGSLHYLDNYEAVRDLFQRLLTAGAEVLALDLPDVRFRSEIVREYDTTEYPHVYFDEDELRRDFGSIEIVRGRLAEYPNDRVRFALHLQP